MDTGDVGADSVYVLPPIVYRNMGGGVGGGGTCVKMGHGKFFEREVWDEADYVAWFRGKAGNTAFREFDPRNSTTATTAWTPPPPLRHRGACA